MNAGFFITADFLHTGRPTGWSAARPASAVRRRFPGGNVKPALNMFPRGIKRPYFPYLSRGYITGI